MKKIKYLVLAAFAAAAVQQCRAAIQTEDLASNIVVTVTAYVPAVRAQALTAYANEIASTLINTVNDSDLRTNLVNQFQTNSALAFLDWGNNSNKLAEAAAAVATKTFHKNFVQNFPLSNPEALQKLNDGSNVWGIISFWSGAKMSNPYKIDATGKVSASDHTSDGYIEINLSSRWIVRSGIYADDPVISAKHAEADYGYIHMVNPLVRMPDIETKIGYLFRGSGTVTNSTIGTVVGSSDIYADTSVGLPFIRYESVSRAWKQQVTLELNGGFTTDKDHLSLHPVAFFGGGYQSSFALSTNQATYWSGRLGVAYFDQPSLTSSNTVQINGLGEPAFHGAWAPAMGGEFVYPITSALSVQAGFNAYLSNSRYPASWNATLGITADLGKLIGALK
jgi:hypothetical protein